MPTRKSPRKGSLQFWPRKRANKFLPSVNWNALNSDSKLKGFIVYKAGMASAFVKDNTIHSMTKDKKIVIPITILECPPMKIFSARFYKRNKLAGEVLNKNLDKELKRKLKLPKKYSKTFDSIKPNEYSDIRMLVYSNVKKTNIKKTPDMIEVGLTGTNEEKLNFIKEHSEKEILVSEAFQTGQLVDVKGLTKGKGLVGPVKRFGIQLKASKSEKGRRRPGSLAPWHPARVTFRTPMAGQLGMFTRTVYNNKIVDMGHAENKFKDLKNFGDLKTDYILIKGSVQGPSKRQLVITAPLRTTKKQGNKNFELLELR